jgi:hypothetical protein
MGSATVSATGSARESAKVSARVSAMGSARVSAMGSARGSARESATGSTTRTIRRRMNMGVKKSTKPNKRKPKTLLEALGLPPMKVKDSLATDYWIENTQRIYDENLHISTPVMEAFVAGFEAARHMCYKKVKGFGTLSEIENLGEEET